MRRQFLGSFLSCAAEISACWHPSAQVKYLFEMTACLRKEESDTCVSSSCSFSCLEKSTIFFLPYRRAGIIFLEAEFNFPDNIPISYLSLLAFAWALLSLSCRFLQVFARFSEKFALFPHHHLYCARNYRPSFRENKPKTLVLYDWKWAFWACFHENWVYKFGHCTICTITQLFRFLPQRFISVNFWFQRILCSERQRTK